MLLFYGPLTSLRKTVTYIGEFPIQDYGHEGFPNTGHLHDEGHL